MTLRKRPLQNMVGKGENAGNQHFLFFTPCFLPIPKHFNFLIAFNLLSANAFNLEHFKILLFGKESSERTERTCRQLINLYPNTPF